MTLWWAWWPAVEAWKLPCSSNPVITATVVESSPDIGGQMSLALGPRRLSRPLLRTLSWQIRSRT